jgi:protein-S-isoprenylcysteine O-methyltransferase Ste14
MTTRTTTHLASRLHGTTARVVAAAAIALFAAAGTPRYWQAWVYLGWQVVSMTGTNLYLLRHDPELARRRLAMVETGERQGVHKAFAALVQILGLAILLVSALDHRFGWSAVPLPLTLAGCLGVAAGTVVVFRVFQENSHASSVVTVEEGQPVVATGLYRFVRHPMYAGALLGTLASPLALGSYVAEVCFPPALALFMVRILAEERYLSGALDGYAGYMERTRKRLVPGVF